MLGASWSILEHLGASWSILVHASLGFDAKKKAAFLQEQLDIARNPSKASKDAAHCLAICST